jgi:hypothetical protein
MSETLTDGLDAVDAELASAKQQVDDACDRASRIVEHRFIAAVRELSARYPRRLVTGCIAMGAYTLTAAGKGWRAGRPECDVELKHPVLDTIARIDSDYGWAAIPVLLVHGEGGNVKLARDWGRLADGVQWETPPA